MISFLYLSIIGSTKPCRSHIYRVRISSWQQMWMFNTRISAVKCIWYAWEGDMNKHFRFASIGEVGMSLWLILSMWMLLCYCGSWKAAIICFPGWKVYGNGMFEQNNICRTIRSGYVTRFHLQQSFIVTIDWTLGYTISCAERNTHTEHKSKVWSKFIV